jgi:hypothetical protein
MQTWSGTATVAATILLVTQAGAHPCAGRATAGPGMIPSAFADENASRDGGTVEPDPIDDGSIIVECIGHDGASDADELRDHSTMRGPELLATPPRIPLDPSQC